MLEYVATLSRCARFTFTRTFSAQRSTGPQEFAAVNLVPLHFLLHRSKYLNATGYGKFIKKDRTVCTVYTPDSMATACRFALTYVLGAIFLLQKPALQCGNAMAMATPRSSSFRLYGQTLCG